jgi:hypothetical protein
VRPVGELAGAHAPEEVEVLVAAALPIGALQAGFGQRAPAGADGLLALRVDVRQAALDEGGGQPVQLLEVVARVAQLVPPVPEPGDVVLDRLDVLGILGGRVRVVHAQVDAPAVVAGQAEIERDGLGVPDVEVAVGLGRETSDHGPDAAAREIGIDDVGDEVRRDAARLGGRDRRRGGGVGHADELLLRPWSRSDAAGVGRGRGSCAAGVGRGVSRLASGAALGR